MENETIKNGGVNTISIKSNGLINDIRVLYRRLHNLDNLNELTHQILNRLRFPFREGDPKLDAELSRATVNDLNDLNSLNELSINEAISNFSNECDKRIEYINNELNEIYKIINGNDK